MIDLTNFDRIKCRLCSKTFGGRVYRLKQHIAHIYENVAKCLRSMKDDQIRCKKTIEDGRNKKKNNHNEEQEIRTKVDIIGI